MNKIKNLLISNIVPILFIALCIGGIFVSGTPIITIIADVINRFDRNILLVLSLIIPVTCGLGMNFAIVLGAMCGQIGLISVVLANMSGIGAIIVAALISAVLAVVCGILCGTILNKTKGQEMITGMIVGYFSNGIYQFILLFVIGGIIKIESDIILTGGIGIKNTVDLKSMQYSLDGLNPFGPSSYVNVFTGLIFFGAFFGIIMLINMIRARKAEIKYIAILIICVIAIAFGLIAGKSSNITLVMAKAMIKIPIPTFLLITLACYLIHKFGKTKLGQDMRAIGHDREVAGASGIDVERTRIIAVVISTVLAAWGQIIFYQNLGTMDAYYGHEKVGTFCVAAILIGGASVRKATIGQAILGTILFHLLYNISPLASQRLFNDSMIGGYFRMALCYGVIAFALIIHVWESQRKKQ